MKSYYRVMLGRKGGMGEMSRARDTKLGGVFEIKSLPEEFAKDRSARQC